MNESYTHIQFRTQYTTQIVRYKAKKQKRAQQTEQRKQIGDSRMKKLCEIHSKQLAFSTKPLTNTHTTREYWTVTENELKR